VNFQTLRDLPTLLKAYALNPVETMKLPMRLEWSASLTIQIGTALISGFLSGASARTNHDFAWGLFLFPLTFLLVGFVFSGFVFSFFSVFHSTYLDFKRLHSVVVLSLIPYFLLHVFAGFLPPIDLIGFALTSMLLIVGLVEQFALERKGAMKAVGGLAAAFFLIWMSAQIHLAEIPNQRDPASIEPVVTAPAEPANGTAPGTVPAPLSGPQPIEMADPNL
jgi:hypothetical protein